MGSNSGSPMAPTSTTMGGVGGIDSGSAITGGKAGTNEYTGMQTMGGHTFGSAWSPNEQSKTSWKDDLKKGLTGVAQAKLDDLQSFSQGGFTPQQGNYQDTPAWQRGYSTQDLYNAQIKNQPQIQRYRMGRSL
jgi:hypothetical protein